MFLCLPIYFSIFMVGHRQQQEKKHYDKAKAAFEAADTKLRQLKSKEDAKAFDIEKERNVLQVHLPLRFPSLPASLCLGAEAERVRWCVVRGLLVRSGTLRVATRHKRPWLMPSRRTSSPRWKRCATTSTRSTTTTRARSKPSSSPSRRSTTTAATSPRY